MSKTIRTNEKLWDEIKKEMLLKNNNNWNARLAQQAVLEYKRRGGDYIGKKTSETPLVKWTKEDWGYVGEPKKSRYLPKKIREVMPERLKVKENKLKSDKLGENVPYSKELIKIMKKKNII